MGMISSGVGESVFNRASSELGAAPGTGVKTLGKEDFTRLLITQIQNQDPLQPMSNTEFVAQLAQFSSLEQLSLANSSLEQLQLYQHSINRVQAALLLGKEIKAEGNTVFLTGDSPVSLNYRLQGDALMTRLYIYDGQFELVKMIQVDARPAGEHSVTWDGRDSNGVKRSPGTYSFMVESVDAQGNHISADTFTTGKVTGLSYQGGMVNLLLGQHKIPVQNLILVNQSEEEGK